jgi:hypothetical protein
MRKTSRPRQTLFAATPIGSPSWRTPSALGPDDPRLPGLSAQIEKLTGEIHDKGKAEYRLSQDVQHDKQREQPN